jgi:cyanophycin synthetase
MQLLDSRRLTGPNLLWERPGAVLDISFGDCDPGQVIAAWQTQARRLLDAANWKRESTCVRRFAGGASLAISAPVDALYAATELNEAAWDAARDAIEGGNRHLLARVAAQLRNGIHAEQRPRLRRLLAAAAARDVPALLDTSEVSLGLGARSRCWSLDEVPTASAVDWDALGRIPVALVTGTNGKTTTVRLMSAIGRAAGFCTGISSTDWLAIDGDIIERDDYAGPEGARRILRDRRTELAILETARGGLLRRGLALERADAALITNVAADHMGEFGVHDLEELADVKWVVTRALVHGGTLVLNADDPRLVARAAASALPLIWFSPDAHNPVLRAQLRGGGRACTIRDGRIVLRHGRRSESVIAVADVPITLGGVAQHNVVNALGAVALAHALGIATGAIAEGLRALRVADNPGRANLYRIGGAQVLVDFAHNPHGVRALMEVARRLPSRRRLLVIGQAGDRGDEDIRDLARATAALRFDRILIKRLGSYSRGRAPGETARLLRAAFLAEGYAARQLGEYETEMGAVRAALKWAGPDDLLLLLAHEDRDAVLAHVGALQDPARDG